MGEVLAIGQTDSHTGTEGITGTGGVLDLHLPGGANTVIALAIGIDSALFAHGDHHGREPGLQHLFLQNVAHLVRRHLRVVIQEKLTGFLLVADEAVKLLQKIPALDGDAHVGHQAHFLNLCKKHGIERPRIQYHIFDENNRCTISQRLKENHGAFIFCNNAYLVRDIYVAAYENSMIPGKDFQIMAIASGITFTGLIPSLSYVRVPLYEVGLQLIRMAHRKFRNPGADIRWEPVQPEIVLNETSKLKNKNKECI